MDQYFSQKVSESEKNLLCYNKLQSRIKCQTFREVKMSKEGKKNANVCRTNRRPNEEKL